MDDCTELYGGTMTVIEGRWRGGHWTRLAICTTGDLVKPAVGIRRRVDAISSRCKQVRREVLLRRQRILDRPEILKHLIEIGQPFIDRPVLRERV